MANHLLRRHETVEAHLAETDVQVAKDESLKPDTDPEQDQPGLRQLREAMENAVKSQLPGKQSVRADARRYR